MAKRLKCWKKFGKVGDVDIWKHSDNKKVTLRKINKNKYSVNTFSDGRFFSDSRKEAFSFAQKFMEEHDTC